MFVFILPFLVGPAAGGFGSGPKILVADYQTNWTGLLTFLTTDQVIWLKYSNKSVGNIECLGWKKTALTGNSYTFVKSYHEGWLKKSFTQKAELINVTEKPAIKMLSGPYAGERYIMDYWNFNEKCALFFGPEFAEQFQDFFNYCI
ncbi:uncharacterized protein LOC119405969 isoform X2 [Rhipicephalus sanguineus]|uniref:uncharacterized protein LOC119405969 isoform X2 n=1 Tax=Rhipicephalus sanguineus TaxID=34632 RepID=UPI0018956996|nr:uncharacterized protein LOC119405969 isoform X2 [Rhipicephalus sanguineus]